MSDPASRAAIFDGHRRLVSGFRDFGADEVLASELPLDLVQLRAVAAFLRQEILPFSRWEESVLRSAPEEWETAAFDHGFLAAEIDAFTEELRALERALETGTKVERRRGSARLLRRVHRVEAVLELHAQRAEDRGIRVDPPDQREPE